MNLCIDELKVMHSFQTPYFVSYFTEKNVLYKWSAKSQMLKFDSFKLFFSVLYRVIGILVFLKIMHYYCLKMLTD